MWPFRTWDPACPSRAPLFLSRADISRPDADILRLLQVLFCYEQFDELTLLHLREFDKKKLISVETDIVVDHYKEEKLEDGSPGQLAFCWAQAWAVAWGCGEAGSGGYLYGVFFACLYLGSPPCTKEAVGNIFV